MTVLSAVHKRKTTPVDCLWGSNSRCVHWQRHLDTIIMTAAQEEVRLCRIKNENVGVDRWI